MIRSKKMNTEKITCHREKESCSWDKPFTFKRYINPPFAENIITQWSNTMILIGENAGGSEPQLHHNGHVNDSRLPSAAMLFLYKNRIPDLKNVDYITRFDGIPVHGLVKDLGSFSLKMEAFSDTERIPTAYLRITVKNTADFGIEDTISLLCRTDSELELIGARDPDGYDFPKFPIERWLESKPWECSEGRISDGIYKIYYNLTDGLTAKARDNGIVDFNFVLESGAELSFDLAFGRGDVSADFSYDEEKKRTENFWEKELSKIMLFPNKEDPELYAMYKSLVAEILQMFNYPKGVNYVHPRQGGLQRFLWPVEFREMIKALARIGDFERYLDESLNTLFHVMQSHREENYGQVVNFGIPWGAVTGSALECFAASAMSSRRLYERYKDSAYSAFLWIESFRSTTKGSKEYAHGLFPPLQSCDAPTVGQLWGLTDAWNIQGYRMYLEALEMYGDEHIAEVKAAIDDYFSCMQAVFNRCVVEPGLTDDTVIPLDARCNPEIERAIEEHSFQRALYEYFLISIGLAGYGTPLAERMIERCYKAENAERGLTLGSKQSGVRHNTRYYGSLTDSEMYYYYRRLGEDDKAREILEAQLKYYMTEEYYMGERYDKQDPYYFPWSPNGSASGRTILMLCDFYGCI